MHKNEVLPGFTKRYGIKTLVWYEQHETREAALTRTSVEEMESGVEAADYRANEPNLV